MRLRSNASIERETSRKWASRSIARYARYLSTGDAKWLVLSSDYKNEALEHAAMVGDYGKFVSQIQRRIERRMKRLDSRRGNG